VENIGQALAKHPPLEFKLETIDVFSDPQRLLRESVFATPTLVATDLARRVVGDLSDASLLEFFLQTLIKCDRPQT
jgi:hypothetical protein